MHLPGFSEDVTQQCQKKGGGVPDARKEGGDARVREKETYEGEGEGA